MKTEQLKIGEVDFQIEKLPAMEAWRVFEKIRHAFATCDIGDPKGIGQIVTGIKAVMALPVEFVDGIRAELFTYIKFRTKQSDGNMSDWITLSGMEATAFEDLEAVAVYNLISRSLSVNFTESFNAIILKFPALSKILPTLQKQ